MRMGGRGGTAARGPGPATATAPEEAPVEAAAGVVVAAVQLKYMIIANRVSVIFPSLTKVLFFCWI